MFRTIRDWFTAQETPTAVPRLGLENLESRDVASVTWHGGYVLPRVEAQNVFLGTDWQSAALQQTVANLEGFTKTLVNSPFMDDLYYAGYGVGRGTATRGTYDPYTINKAYYLNDVTIRNDLQYAIDAGWAAQPDANRLYVVFTEPGVAVQDGAETSTPGTPGAFGGYHTSFIGTNRYGQAADIRYAVVVASPYTAAQVGFPSDLSLYTTTASHEIAEAVTDPDGGDPSYKPGWYDDQIGLTGEVGDLANGNFQQLYGYYVQLIANKAGQPMPVVAGPIQQLGGYAGNNMGTGEALPSTHTTHDALDVLTAGLRI